MSHRRTARVVLGQIELLESRRLLDSGDAWQRGVWNGAGITTADASAGQFGIGYAEASSVATFPGLTGFVDDSGVLLRLTRYGDASLDGVIDLSDFEALVRNFDRSGTTWSHGDFNYDGTVNLSDFNRLSANFGLSASGADVTAADWAALAAAVGVQPTYAVDDDGTLRVTGSKFTERIVVDSTTLANMRDQHPGVRIKRVHVDAGAGDDVVEMKIGLPATIVGGKGNDTLTGGGRADLISGGAGDDDVHGGSGNDTLEGLAGSDYLNGHAGADLVLGGADMDFALHGGSGDDTIHAGAGGGVCYGQDGNDLLYGNGGEAHLYGGPGLDRFKCRDGNTTGARDLIFTGPAGQGDRVLAMDDDDVMRPGGF
jgi:hypothetical protein